MEVQLVIRNPEGLHARPAGIFAKKAAEFQSNIQVSVSGQMKSAKSIMGLMSLSLKKDQPFTLIIDGPDAAKRNVLKQAIVNAGNTPAGLAALAAFWGKAQGLQATTSAAYAVLANALQTLKLDQSDLMPG